MSPITTTSTGRRWKPVTATRQVNLCGGFATTASVVGSVQLEDSDGVQQDYIHVSAQAPWLLKMCKVDGKPGDLHRSTLIKELLAALIARSRGDEVVVDADPMASVELETGNEILSTGGRSYKKRRKNDVIDVTMRLRPKSASPKSDETYTFHALAGFSHKSCYVDARDIPWLVAYITDEVRFGGVVVSDDAAPDPNATVVASGVPGLRIEWCFSDRAYVGEFVSGPLHSQKYKSAPRNITREKWERLQSAGSAQGDYCDATADAMSHAAVAHLKAHCQAALTAIENPDSQ